MIVTEILKSFICTFKGHLPEITEELEEQCRLNPDKDFDVYCIRCGYPGKAYWSEKRQALHIYQDDSPAIFGDVYRD